MYEEADDEDLYRKKFRNSHLKSFVKGQDIDPIFQSGQSQRIKVESISLLSNLSSLRGWSEH